MKVFSIKCIDPVGLSEFVNRYYGPQENMSAVINSITSYAYTEVDGVWRALYGPEGYVRFQIVPEMMSFFIMNVTEVRNATIDLSSSFNASLTVPKRDTGFVFGKLIEEVGEFTKSINQPGRCDEEPVGEAADVINCVVDLLYLHYVRANPDKSEQDVIQQVVERLNKELNKKSAKWIEKATS